MEPYKLTEAAVQMAILVINASTRHVELADIPRDDNETRPLKHARLALDRFWLVMTATAIAV